MKLCIVDKNLPETSKMQLRTLGFITIDTLPLDRLSSSLKTHSDIQVCKIKNNFIVVEPTVYPYYKNLLSKYDIIVKSGIKFVEDTYPEDSIYNLASNGEIAIHNFKMTDKGLKEEIDFKRIQVNQGYGKCNVLFTKNGVITSDKGIFNALGDGRKLLISPGQIELDGFDYGFIGGASGYLDKVYFIGDIRKHSDFEKIKEFLKDEETDYVILGDHPLKDFGSLIFLEN